MVCMDIRYMIAMRPSTFAVFLVTSQQYIIFVFCRTHLLAGLVILFVYILDRYHVHVLLLCDFDEF